MNNITLRAISGFIYILVIVGAIVSGPIPFILLTSVFACLAMAEFNQMAHINEPIGDKSTAIFAVDIAGVMLITSVPAIVFNLGFGLLATMAVFSAYMLTRCVLALYDTRSTAFRECMTSLMGIMYIGLPLLTLNLLYIYDIYNTSWLVLIMFIMIWLNDTGAFLFGSKFGKKKLCERLSPKKSWEGFYGGMLCCVLCGVIVSFVTKISPFNTFHWIILGILICLFATWGDLFESLIKRTVKVKDSGNIIPGHGGILDRIDSLLFVAPATFILYYLVSVLQ